MSQKNGMPFVIMQVKTKKHDMEVQIMKTRKKRLKIMIALMALVLITALTVSAFAEETVSDAAEATVNSQEQSAKPEKKADIEPEKEADEYGGLSREERAELEGIYARFEEIRNEFENLHNTHKDEIIKLKERARELEEKAGWCDHCCCCRHCRDDWDDFDEEVEDSQKGRHDPGIKGKQHDRDRFENEEAQNDIYLEDKTAFETDNPTDERAELMKRLFELMLGTQDGSAWNHGEDEITETEDKPYIGLMVSSLPEEVVSLTGIEAGALVCEVMENSPAAEAGIQPYDIIVKAGDQKIASSDDLVTVVSAANPGDRLCFQLCRQGKELELDITVRTENESTAKGKDLTA